MTPDRPVIILPVADPITVDNAEECDSTADLLTRRARSYMQMAEAYRQRASQLRLNLEPFAAYVANTHAGE